MTYYHVYIEYRTKNGNIDRLIAFNKSEEWVKKYVASPYIKNKSFIFVGSRIHPSSIVVIYIFESEKSFKDLILPNEKPIMDADNRYVAMRFSQGDVKGVHSCTESFLFSLPEEKEELRKPLTKPSGKKEKVFIIHGTDETQALRLQKYLRDKLKVDAECLRTSKKEAAVTQ